MLPITLLQLIFNIFYLRQCGSHIFKQLFSFVLCDAQWLRDTTIFVQAALAQLRSHRKAIRQVRLSELATVLIVQAALAQLGIGITQRKFSHILQITLGVASIIRKPLREVF